MWNKQKEEKQTKQAEYGSGIGWSHSHATNAYDGYQNDHPVSDVDKYRYMNYNVQAPFNRGDKVQMNAHGFAFTGQMEGVVEKIDEEKIVVRWTNGKYKDKKTAFRLDDTVRLSYLRKI